MTQDRDLDAHNSRVRAFADRMPPGTLANAIRAVGYAADRQTGITSGFTIGKLAELSAERFGGTFSISRAPLADAIAVLRANRVLTVMAGKEQAEDGTWRNRRSGYRINFEWQGDTRKLRSDLMGKRQRRRNRQRANIVPDGTMTPPADDDADRMASLTQWDDGPPAHDPWCQNDDCPGCWEPPKPPIFPA